MRKVREEVLRLLKEDEGFKALVRVYLGLEDLFSRIDNLTKAVEELRRVTELQGERLDRLERSMEKLIEVSERHEQRINELSERLDRLVEVSERHERRLSRLERDVRAMRRSMDRISISLEEEEANDMVTYFLRQRGVELETRPTRFDTRYEFDIYGTNGRITVIGEAKVRAGPKSVDRLCERVERARQLWPEKFPGEVILVLYCMRVEPGAIEAAEREGVWLLESMKEKVPLKL